MGPRAKPEASIGLRAMSEHYSREAGRQRASEGVASLGLRHEQKSVLKAKKKGGRSLAEPRPSETCYFFVEPSAMADFMAAMM